MHISDKSEIDGDVITYSLPSNSGITQVYKCGKYSCQQLSLKTCETVHKQQQPDTNT